jgi:hypothetical protein
MFDAGAGPAVAQARPHLPEEGPEDGADVLGAESGRADGCLGHADRLAVLDDDIVQLTSRQRPPFRSPRCAN